MSRLDALPTRRLLLAVGVASLVGALALAVVPLPLSGLRPLVAAVANGTTVFLLALAVGVFGAAALYDRGRATAEPDSLGTPEAASYGSAGAAGGDFDDTVGGVDGTLADPRPSEWWELREREAIEDELRDLAVRTLARSERCSPDEAAAMLDAGTWTDDPRARRFLGGPDAPDPPLRLQLADWLSGEAYDRHVEHTVAAIAAHADGEVETE